MRMNQRNNQPMAVWLMSDKGVHRLIDNERTQALNIQVGFSSCKGGGRTISICTTLLVLQKLHLGIDFRQWNDNV